MIPMLPRRAVPVVGVVRRARTGVTVARYRAETKYMPYCVHCSVMIRAPVAADTANHKNV